MMLGICFGHQVLAHALGGRAEKSRKGYGVGVHTIAMHQRKPWMQPFLKEVSLLYSHQDQVVVLPPGADLLGGNEFCPNAMFSIGDTVLGIQGHPEFEPAYEKAIMDLRVEIIGRERYQKAVASLIRPADEETAGKWMVNFLSGAVRP
jgi:GMP synthase-like glutamine amidotransferase